MQCKKISLEIFMGFKVSTPQVLVNPLANPLYAKEWSKKGE